MDKIYKKHNSFVSLQGKYEDDYNNFLKRLKSLLTDDQLKKFNLTNQKIIKKIETDIFGNDLENNLDDTNKFSIKQNVIDEIKTINDNDLLRYLIHRYRYEIYPEKKIVDEYPPYLQIEPSSICNYRCVFCFMTDNSFNKKSSGYMGHMNLEMFKNIIDQAEGNIEFLSLASRGEPMINPQINKMLEYTIDKFLNLKINTNASLLTEKKFMQYLLEESKL